MIAEDADITKTFHVKHALPRPSPSRKLLPTSRAATSTPTREGDTFES